jgi:hypothetical protein
MRSSITEPTEDSFDLLLDDEWGRRTCDDGDIRDREAILARLRASRTFIAAGSFLVRSLRRRIV